MGQKKKNMSACCLLTPSSSPPSLSFSSKCKGSKGTHLSPMCLCFVEVFPPLCSSLIYIETAEKEQTLLSLTLFSLTHSSLLHKKDQGDVSRWTKFARIKWSNKGRSQDYWKGWTELMDGRKRVRRRETSPSGRSRFGLFTYTLYLTFSPGSYQLSWQKTHSSATLTEVLLLCTFTTLWGL